MALRETEPGESPKISAETVPRTSRLAQASATVGIGVSLVAPLALPASLNPAASLLCGLVVAGALLLLGGLTAISRPVKHSHGLLVLALAAYLTIAAAWSHSPGIALWGLFGQHGAAATWLLAAAWALIGWRLAPRRAAVPFAATIAAFGGISAAWALAELASGTRRQWGSVAGPFENSSSLGAFLALSIVACAYLVVTSRAVAWRLGAGTLAAVCLAGLAVAESRLGFVALAAAAAVGVAVAKPWARRARIRRGVAIGIPSALVALSLLGMAAATGELGTGARQLIAGVGTERDAIWASAGRQIAAHPLVGTGMEQFSAWVSWSYTQQAGLRYNGTYDPHSFILALLAGGGFVALLLWTAWFAFFLLDCLRCNPSRGSFAVGMMVALWTAALFAWVSPASMMAAFAFAYALLRDDEDAAQPQLTESWRGRAPSLALAATALLFAAWAVPAFLAELQQARTPATTAPQAMNAWGAWPDPQLSAKALVLELASGRLSTPEQLEAAMPGWTDDRSWHVDLALASLFHDQAQLAAGDDAAWDDIEACVRQAKEADPASGIWDFAAAMSAAQAGRPQRAGVYAAQALRYPLSPYEAALMRDLTGR